MELYYYTSTDTMQYILKNGDIFATNIRYMNDSEEYINGLKELKKLADNEELVAQWLKKYNRNDISVENVKETFTDENLRINMQNMEYYSISFCGTNDLLSQWAIYAKEAGVSIKMNFEKSSYRFLTAGAEERKAEWNLLPQKVHYFTYESMKNQREKYMENAFSVLEQLYPEVLKDPVEGRNETWRYISTFVKRYDFYQEAESRLVFQPEQSVYPPKVEYRNDKHVLKPYLDIECEEGWPIWEIMVGPGFNQQIVYNSIVHFAEHADIKNGIKTIKDYGKRVLNYFHPFKEELKKYDLYLEIEKKLSDEQAFEKMNLEDARITIGGRVKKICRDICECENKGWSKELREYIEKNCFTICGIVISKSSIPYIF